MISAGWTVVGDSHPLGAVVFPGISNPSLLGPTTESDQGVSPGVVRHCTVKAGIPLCRLYQFPVLTVPFPSLSRVTTSPKEHDALTVTIIGHSGSVTW